MNLISKISRRLLASAIEPLETRTFLSASSPDTTFNGTGRNQLTLGGFDAEYVAVTVLPDGRSLAVGAMDTDISGPVRFDFLVARYTAAGKLDTTFGGGTGWVRTDFPHFADGTSNDFGQAVVQLPGGKFAVCGLTSDNDSHSNIAVAQYNANGTLDNTFSGDGKATVDFGVDAADAGNAICVTNTYQLLVAGKTSRTVTDISDNDIALVKFKTDGSLDTSFAGTGKKQVNIGTIFGPNPNSGKDDVFRSQRAHAIHMLPNGNFLIAGEFQSAPTASNVQRDPFVARFLQNGNLDTTFNGGKGFIQTSTAAGSNTDDFLTLAVLPSGQILAGGYTQPNISSINHDFLLVRYNANGTKDNSFGTSGNGVVKTSFNDFGPAEDEMRNIHVLPSGKLLATGGSFPDNPSFDTHTVIARYNANGTLDTSFSGDGKLTSSILTNAAAVGSSLTPDGKYVIVGFNSPTVGIARFGNDAAATAKISGVFYNDLNGNGVKNAGEGPLVGWQAFVDANNDGFWTPGEKIATSNASGAYTITGLPPGTYRIREIRLTNWNRTQPAGAYPLGFYDVTVGVGGSVLGKNFGNKHV